MLPFSNIQITVTSVVTQTPVYLETLNGTNSFAQIFPQPTNYTQALSFPLDYPPPKLTDHIPKSISSTSSDVPSPSNLSVNQHSNVGQPNTTEPTLGCKVDEGVFIQTTIESNHPAENSRSTSSVKKITCQYCCKEFSTKSLIFHERIHKGEKPFACSVCGKCFRAEFLLKRHSYTHSPEKSFQCSECGKRFRHHRNLQVHKGVHQERPRHKCLLCSRDFNCKSNLTAHLYTHTESNPHICNCGKSFRRKWYLRRHLQRKVGSGHAAAV